MAKVKKNPVASMAVVTLILSSGLSLAQDLSAPGATANTEVAVNPNLQSNTNAASGGNIFDFSSSGGGRANTPPAPSLPSFAGGPCMGVSGGLSASGPGFAIGGGRSFEDESCQRRNWVQTLVGVSQHMPELEANELKRVAIALMMQDEFVGPAFESLGYDTATGEQRRTQDTGRAEVGRRASQSVAVEPVRASMGSGCVTVVPTNASSNFRTLLEARGCEIRSR